MGCSLFEHSGCLSLPEIALSPFVLISSFAYSEHVRYLPLAAGNAKQHLKPKLCHLFVWGFGEVFQILAVFHLGSALSTLERVTEGMKVCSGSDWRNSSMEGWRSCSWAGISQLHLWWGVPVLPLCISQSWCSGFNSSSTRSNAPEKFLTLKKLSFSPCAKMRAMIWIIVVCDYSSVKNKYSCDFKSNWAWFSLGLVVALGFSSMAWSQAPWGDSEGGDLVCHVRFVPWNLGARGCSLL